jgi:hypothetical protein
MCLRYEAFIDESLQNDEFVLAGHIARAEGWIALSKDWGELLPFGTLSENNKHHFKMSEMASNSQRMSRVPAFYKLIENHVVSSISFHIRLSSLKRAKKRAEDFMLHSAGRAVDFNNFANPYFFSVVHFLTGFYERRRDIDGELNEFLPPSDAKIDFIFDQNTESSSVLRAWDYLVEDATDEERESFGKRPRFENDQVCVPLQAADLSAWWAAHWYEEDGDNATHPIKMQNADFGFWRGKKRHGIAFAMNEDQITDALQRLGFYAMARDHYGE